MMKTKFFTLFTVMLLCGCGVLNHHLKSVKNSAATIKETRESYEKKYLGQNKSLLLHDFGRPRIRYNVNHIGVVYDEEWFYNTKKGYWDSDVAQSVWFAINNDIIGYVYVW